jgi:hypothetical protein
VNAIYLVWVNRVKIHQGNMHKYGITITDDGKVTGIGCD